MTRCAAIILLAIVGIGSACADATEPKPARRLPFAPGPFVLAASVLADYPQEECSGTGTWIGVSVVSPLQLSQEGDTTVARSAASSDGDVEIRLVASGLRFGVLTIEGTARGTVIDRRAESALGVVTLRFDADLAGTRANFEGTAFPDSIPDFLGKMYGTLRMSGPLGSGTCRQGQWRIRRP